MYHLPSRAIRPGAPATHNERGLPKGTGGRLVGREFTPGGGRTVVLPGVVRHNGPANFLPAGSALDRAQIEIPRHSDRLRVVVTADNHLGRYHDRLPPARLEARRAALRHAFGAVVDGAVRDRAALFLQAGDLFDTPDPRNAERAFVATELARLRAAGIPVLAIGGNHDTPRQRTDHGGLTPQEVFARLNALTLLADPGRVATAPIRWGDRRVTVGGLGWNPVLTAGQDPLAGLADWQPEADLRILLIHQAIEGHIYPGANEPIVPLRSLEALDRVGLVVAGHVHRPAIVRLPGRTVVIPGATEKMTFGPEEGDPGYWVIDLDPDGQVAAIDRRGVPHQPRRELTLATADLPEDDPGDHLRRRVEPLCDPDTLVRLRLAGSIARDRYQVLDLRGLIEFALTRAFAFNLDTSELYLADERGISAARGVRLSPADEIARVAADLAAAEPDPLWATARDRILADLR